ncbi:MULTISPECIES: hypothetical protein [unclassified Chitinophaga]|uniref:hypothetical protein n=1 Tax=unclassified Chitinophaga TaxID=2619133 RepID=UPI0009D2EBCA|nr:MULTISPECIES: hypothetical protein [unclassified Chitinophaga]OMP76248.1 hypothetical protein BW716_26070 [[Flexibacter] sp. ATCC 35208]WPV64823.1 hypothetical protein QQL36_23760 [Chitinophaga sp. LS1]
MKTTLTLPNNFMIFSNEPIISRFNYKINYHIAKLIKGRHEYALYLAPHFVGIVWFDDTLGYWVAEVFLHHTEYRGSYLAETLVELADEIDAAYRDDEPRTYYNH